MKIKRGVVAEEIRKRRNSADRLQDVAITALWASYHHFQDSLFLFMLKIVSVGKVHFLHEQLQIRTGSIEAMQLWCITALLLSAVSACRGDDEQLVTRAYGDGGSGGHPLSTDETPPWFPEELTTAPGDGRSWESMNGTDENDHQLERSSEVSTESEIQVPGVMPGPSQHFGRPQGGNWHDKKNISKEFIPTFKVVNVTFQNNTPVALKEGKNIFLMPKFGGRGHHHMHGGRGRHHHMGGGQESAEIGHYVNLTYNTTEPDKVSIEYGAVKLVSDVKPGVNPRPGHGIRRPRRPSRGHRWPNRRNPFAKKFSAIFKVDNVTFQNDTAVALKEGGNIFLMPKEFGGRGHHHMHGGRGRHHHMGGGQGPVEIGHYVNLTYNTTEPDKVSVEYGVVKLMKLSEMVDMENDPEEDYY